MHRNSKRIQIYLLNILMVLALFLSGCSMDWVVTPTSTLPTETPESEATPVPLPPTPETIVNFRVEVPANTPADAPIYLTILDEVTGLALNPTYYTLDPAEPEQSDEANRSYYSINLPLPVGSVIKYRYERQAEAATVIEHVSDGRTVRYRLYHVEGPGIINDVVSRWTDTPFDSPSGRIMGQATDAESGKPIPNLLVTAGGQQTFTASDGSFLLEGLPPGVHNLVGYALDGSYKIFQQGARVAAESTTPAPLKLSAAPTVKVVFVVKVPEGTPPVIPVRLAGSLFQTGNTFSDLSGGTSTLAINMPVLDPLPDGRYSLTMTLPVGADLRYKYTLGDGFWNAEHAADGSFKLRQVVVPDHNTLIEDEVVTWQSGSNAYITFDVSVPASTPADDIVTIQFNPLFGWTEPIPMWHIGENRWAYVLYGPLNLPGELKYRYCRNGLCGVADDADTAGLQSPGRSVVPGKQKQIIKEEVKTWVDWGASTAPEAPLDAEVAARSDGFMAGVELQDNYHPSWRALLPNALADIKSTGANWIVFSPTWTYTRNNPPVLEPVSGQDALWLEQVNSINLAQADGLNVAIHPRPEFLANQDEWWENSTRDFAWWLVWFEQYHKFAINFADLAAQTNAPYLVLGDQWVKPSLPGGTLANGNPSGVPADSETRWRDILADVRSHYQGKILWAMSSTDIQNPPPFLDALDGIYLLWSPLPSEQPEISQEDLEANAAKLLDNGVRTVELLYDKSIYISAFFPSAVSLQAQAEAYAAILNVINQRDWISGFISSGYYLPAALQDKSASVHGKPASEVLKYWYPKMLAVPEQ